MALQCYSWHTIASSTWEFSEPIAHLQALLVPLLCFELPVLQVLHPAGKSVLSQLLLPPLPAARQHQPLPLLLAGIPQPELERPRLLAGHKAGRQTCRRLSIPSLQQDLKVFHAQGSEDASITPESQRAN